MLERAVTIAGFCIRRLIERRMVTDRFRESTLPVHVVSSRNVNTRKEQFIRSTSGSAHQNYDLTARQKIAKSPKFISDKIVHVSHIAILSRSEFLPDGLLIASDHQSRESLFHFKPEEFEFICEAFLNDFVKTSIDGIDPETGEVFARRE